MPGAFRPLPPARPWAHASLPKAKPCRTLSAMTDLKSQIEDFGRRARAAARVLARTSAEQKNRGLLAMADEIVAVAPTILEANAQDVAKASADGLSKAMIDRLT